MSKTIEGNAHISTVPLGLLRVSTGAQREFNETWGDYVEKNFDIDLVGLLTVSHRDGFYWVIDGQHRTHGLISWAKREFGDDWADWTVHVNAHPGLTEQDESGPVPRAQQAPDGQQLR
jgi:hypothetical protein